MADFKIIENWLPKDIFDKVQSDIVWNPEFPVTLSNRVAREEEKEPNWYATHLFYDMDIPCSHYWTVIDEFFLGKFRQMNICRSFIRAKLNFYPNTGDMIEHPQHIDEVNKLVDKIAQAKEKLDVLDEFEPAKGDQL